jgi:hypothetical protein
MTCPARSPLTSEAALCVRPAGPVVDTWECNGGTNQNFSFSASSGLLATQAGPFGPSVCVSAAPVSPNACTNVWGRVLSDGYALGFVNNGDAAATVTCDSACFGALNITATSLKVRTGIT